MGLTKQADTPLGKLSGGKLQRAGVAQALINSPRLLLLDEPTAGLDPEQRLAFRELIRSLDNITVLLSTHLAEDVAAVCDGVVVLHHGRVAFEGSVQALERLSAQRAPLGSAAMSPLEAGYLATIHHPRESSS